MNQEIKMISNKPYLLRAFFDWIVDSKCTPYIMVDATRSGVDVPEQFVKDGKIVLNIEPMAVQALDMNLRSISFAATFSGIEHQIYIPIRAIESIYAMETGQGMMFDPNDDGDVGGTGDDQNRPSGKPNLRIVD